MSQPGRSVIQHVLAAMNILRVTLSGNTIWLPPSSTSFTVLYVQTPRESTERISLASQRYLLNHFKLVTELGGDVLQVFSESITEAIIETCREKQITTICMGHPAFKMPQTIFQIGKYKKFLQALAEMPDFDYNCIKFNENEWYEY